eukprot:TRINITY_DN1792_c2_g1_i1.p1 TRINITY_DN1792_c2_g1~~TRINITY_DN1792_c2_g1_i1.p1  ORF type:complete len:545 (+),score=84.15 TRINITY_DN1792_c2_g1_i1:162-1637(+)
MTTWNVAAINNNPFEYWIQGSKGHSQLLRKVGEAVKSPGSNFDILLEELFTPAMAQQLFDEMRESNWKGIPEVESRWTNDLSKRTAVSGFLKDAEIGKKRLISMFDRTTNTISTVDSQAMRPTAVNCYAGTADFHKVKQWWQEWITFVFRTRVVIKNRTGQKKQKLIREVLRPISRMKYPAITEEEELMSVPLQVLYGALFDVVVVNLLNSIDPSWASIRQEACALLNKNKVSRTTEIITTQYAPTSSVIFLQETSRELVLELQNSISGTHTVHVPLKFDNDRGQNSIILLKNSDFDNVEEVTSSVLSRLQRSGLANGDLFGVTARHIPSSTLWVLVSYHGDSNGMFSIPVVSAVHSLGGQNNRKIAIGMDANTHEYSSPDLLGVVQFVELFVAKDLSSCWGENPNPQNYTTFNARTHLQSQLNAAIAYEDRTTSGDRNPKDFILFSRKDFKLLKTSKDNTGKHQFNENSMFPTMTFPSDHGIISSELQMR